MQVVIVYVISSIPSPDQCIEQLVPKGSNEYSDQPDIIIIVRLKLNSLGNKKATNTLTNLK